MTDDPVPPEITFDVPKMIASNTPWNINMTSGNYPYYPQYPTQYGPLDGSYPLTINTDNPPYVPFTEERLRQIIREELSAYFDEGKDVLAAPAKHEDYPFFSIQKELHEALLAVGTLDDDPLSEQDRLESEQRSLAAFSEDDTLS